MKRKHHLSKDHLHHRVNEAIKNNDLLSQSLPIPEENENSTIGERIADSVAEFGGSWKFIIIFVSFLIGWIIINSILLFYKPYDPYPFILLNLILSCVAALQAPVIMMSQNRQEQKDRQRAENDYLINLKAEMEIRKLNEKMDLLIAELKEKKF